MYFDGSYTLKGAGAGIMLIPPKGDMLKYVIQIEFPATNNTIEYEGLVAGLLLVKELGIRRLLIRGDSQLVAKQVQKSTTVTTIRWQNIWRKCEEWRSF
jgi:ribonuclease HI